MTPRRFWTPDEVDALRRLYPHHSAATPLPKLTAGPSAHNPFPVSVRNRAAG